MHAKQSAAEAKTVTFCNVNSCNVIDMGIAQISIYLAKVWQEFWLLQTQLFHELKAQDFDNGTSVPCFVNRDASWQLHACATSCV